MSSICQKLILSFLMLLILIKTNAVYSPVLELDLKPGNKRHVGRIGTLFPVTQTENRLIYSSIFYMMDNKKALEGNFGAGLRNMIKDKYIFGAYLYGDIRRSLSKKKALFQINTGAELFFRYLEFRVAGYFPINNKVFYERDSTNIDVSYSSSVNQTITTARDNELYESLLTGYDIDIGASIPNLENLSTYVAFYNFLGDGVTMVGVRFRFQYALFHWLSVGGEINYDNKRHWYNYASIKLQYRFDRSNAVMQGLQRKMTLLPVRDIDIVSQITDGVVEVDQQSEDGNIVHVVYVDSQTLATKKINYTGHNVLLKDEDSSSLQNKMNIIKKQSDVDDFRVVDSNIITKKLTTNDKTQAVDPDVKNIVTNFLQEAGFTTFDGLCTCNIAVARVIQNVANATGNPGRFVSSTNGEVEWDEPGTQPVPMPTYIYPNAPEGYTWLDNVYDAETGNLRRMLVEDEDAPLLPPENYRLLAITLDSADGDIGFALVWRPGA